MISQLLRFTAASLMVLLAGCGGSAEQAAPNSTSAPQLATPATPVPSPTAAAAAPASSPAATAGATAPPATSPVAGASVRIALVPDSSEARYRGREQLAQLPLPSEAVGSTRAVSGSITLGSTGAVVRDQSRLVIDLSTLQSDRPNRDNFIKRNTLQTSQFPTSELVPTEVRGLPFPLPTSGEATFQLVGELTVRGVSRPTTWDLTARFDGPNITGSGSTTFRFSDFDMTAPVAGPVLSVEDSLKLEIDFRATRSAPPVAAAEAVLGNLDLRPASAGPL